MSRRPPRAALPFFLLFLLASHAASAGDTGTLVWRSPAGPVDLPVLRMELDLEITGLLLRATLVEEFSNPTGEVIEATYVLPLPRGPPCTAWKCGSGSAESRPR